MNENLPEVSDPDKPGLVFYFDEVHPLFDDAPYFVPAGRENPLIPLNNYS
jgi:hypothetical protein